MNKDWSGNKKSVFTTLGASSHSTTDRIEHDYYATSPKAIAPIFSIHKFDDSIWEPACGGGHLSEAMKEYGKSIYSTDLIDRGYGDDFFDFFASDLDWPGDIITNPPYKYAKEFAEHALGLLNDGKQLAMFLKLTFLEGKARKKFFDVHPPKYIYVFSYRVGVARNGDPEMFNASSAACYAWFIWEKGSTDEPIVRWI